MHSNAFLNLLLLPIIQSQLICEEGYTCYEEASSGLVWVKKDAGNIYGPTCQDVCEEALINNAGIFHSCDPETAAYHDIDSFSDIATGLNFTCQSNGCWDMNSVGEGLITVTRGDDYVKNCYFPKNDTLLSCHTAPGNGNCYGERYSSICPCRSYELDEACMWDEPPNVPATADWGDYEDGTSCIDRINYWRKRACEEEWYECPPSGLPPMTECTCCHECANSQSEYDAEYGSHSSFTRCGDMVQGSGGGGTCADVIDAFISEREDNIQNGTQRCEGHCGPIVSHGCQTFFWGEFEGHYTLNWRTCNTETCDAYCDDPTDNECFSSSSDIAPDTSQCGATNNAIMMNIGSIVGLIAIIISVIIH